MRGRWNYYHNYDYGSSWHRGNRGDHVTGCTPRDWWVSAVDVNNVFSKRVVPFRNKFFEKLDNLPGVTVLNKEGNAYSVEKDGKTKYIKFMSILQDEWREGGWNLKEGFGAFVGDDKESVLNEPLSSHPQGKGLIKLYRIPGDAYDGSTLTAFKNWGKNLKYSDVITENDKIRDFMKENFSEEAFNKFYHIETEKPKEEHQEVEVTSRGKAFVRDFWKAQKAVKQHEVNPLSYSDIEDLQKFVHSDEGFSAFGKYYNYAKKMIDSWIKGESMSLHDAVKIIRESGMKVER